MEVLVYGSAAETAIGRMCERGFEATGHDVTYVERDPPSLPLIGDVAVSRVHDAFERAVQSNDPDLVFVIKGYDLPRNRIERIGNATSGTVVNWNPDNPYQVRSTPREATTYLTALPAYDLVLTWGAFLVEKLEAAGANAVETLPFAYDPEIHYPANPRAKFDCEVAFFGHYSPKREQFLSALTDFDLQVWGNGWRFKCFDRDVRRCYQGPALGTEDYAAGMASADLVVNVVADHNLPSHNMRTFEIPATGSAMVTTRSDGQDRFFPEGEACAMYDDPAELADVVARYLADPDKRRSLAAAARERVEGHAYADRMGRVVSLLT